MFISGGFNMKRINKVGATILVSSLLLSAPVTSFAAGVDKTDTHHVSLASTSKSKQTKAQQQLKQVKIKLKNKLKYDLEAIVSFEQSVSLEQDSLEETKNSYDYPKDVMNEINKQKKKLANGYKAMKDMEPVIKKTLKAVDKAKTVKAVKAIEAKYNKQYRPLDEDLQVLSNGIGLFHEYLSKVTPQDSSTDGSQRLADDVALDLMQFPNDEAQGKSEARFEVQQLFSDTDNFIQSTIDFRDYFLSSSGISEDDTRIQELNGIIDNAGTLKVTLVRLSNSLTFDEVSITDVQDQVSTKSDELDALFNQANEIINTLNQ